MYILIHSFAGRAFSSGWLHQGIRAVCISLLLLVELVKCRVTLRSLFLTMAVVIFAVISRNSGIVSMVDTLIILYVGRLVDFELVAKWVLVASSVTLIAIVIMSQVGVIPDYVSTGTRIRHYLGFRYALYPSVLLSNITCLVLALTERRLIFKAGVLAWLNYILYKLTDSRLSFYLSMFAIILYLFLFVRSRRKGTVPVSNGFLRIMPLMYIVMAIISITITLAYSPFNSSLVALDELLGGRLALGNSALREYGINAFGTRVAMNGMALDFDGLRDTSQAYNYVDCLYVQLLVRIGWVGLSLYLVSMTAVGYSLYKAGNWKYLLAVALVAVHGLIDNLSFYLFWNTFTLLLSGIFKQSVDSAVSSLPDPGRRA